MIVAGIDENGLGPGLGVLVVTAVAVEVPDGDPRACELATLDLGRGLMDSKAVYRRSLASYRRGEAAALAILDACRLPRQRLAELVAALTREPLADPSDPGLALHLGIDLELPLWGGEPSSVTTQLAERGVRVRDVACRVLPPARFNVERVRVASKSTLDYQLFEEAMALLSPPVDHVVADKIGGRKAYADLMVAAGRFTEVVVREEAAARSRYRARFQGRELEMSFVRKGDTMHAPIALASLVGKYVREASMLCLNRCLGFDAPLPHASGYWSDAKTLEAIARFDERLAASIPRDAFLRKG